MVDSTNGATSATAQASDFVGAEDSAEPRLVAKALGSFAIVELK